MSDLTDIQLIKKIREGKKEYENELFLRYQLKAKKLAASYYHSHIDYGIPYDEYYSSALAAIGTVIQKYDIRRAPSVHNYWKQVAINEIHRLERQESYFSGAKGFFGISLDAISPYYDDGLPLSELVSLNDSSVVTGGILDIAESIITNPRNRFGPREQEALLLHLDGKSYKEISRLMNIKPSTCYSHLKRGYERLKKILSSKKVL